MGRRSLVEDEPVSKLKPARVIPELVKPTAPQSVRTCLLTISRYYRQSGVIERCGECAEMF